MTGVQTCALPISEVAVGAIAYLPGEGIVLRTRGAEGLLARLEEKGEGNG